MSVVARRPIKARSWPLRLPHGPLSLAGQYLFASLAILVVTVVVLGVWVGDQIEQGVVNRTAGVTAVYINSIVTPHLQSLTHQPSLSNDDRNALSQILSDPVLSSNFVAVKVWSLDGTVLYSNNPDLLGRHFSPDDQLSLATHGWVSAELSNLDEPENVDERRHWNRLVEVYVPVWERGTDRCIAVAEFYERPDDLDREIMGARLRSWGVVVATVTLAYVLLAGIVKRGSDTIRRQQGDLQVKVAELTLLVEQNGRLRERLHQAAARAATINEQALRRVGADLHDGPGQSLALALLRLDEVHERAGRLGASAEPTSGVGADEFPVIKAALDDALREIRSISAGLRLPELAPLTPADIVGRVVRSHERLTQVRVKTELVGLPEQAPLATKTVLFRALQEGLSNATRHGGGVDVQARLFVEGCCLCLEVSDRGPGFAPDRPKSDGRLGLAGMREQAELLGGHFEVISTPGRGTTLRVSWPLSEADLAPERDEIEEHGGT